MKIYGKIEVVNKSLVQFLRGYNQKHLNAWDQNMVYIQKYYHRIAYTFTGKSPFNIFLDIFHLPLQILNMRNKDG